MSTQYQIYAVGTQQRIATRTSYEDAIVYADAHKTLHGTDAYVVEIRPIYTTRTAADDFAMPRKAASTTADYGVTKATKGA